MPFSLFLALRYLKPKRTSISIITLISILGVMLGITVLVVVISVMTGFVVGVDDADLRDRARRLTARTGGGDADAFLASPPPAWVVGTVEQASEQLGALRDAGVSRVMCQHLLHDDLDAVALLAIELAPRLR